MRNNAKKKEERGKKIHNGIVTEVMTTATNSTVLLVYSSSILSNRTRSDSNLRSHLQQTSNNRKRIWPSFIGSVYKSFDRAKYYYYYYYYHSFEDYD